MKKCEVNLLRDSDERVAICSCLTFDEVNVLGCFYFLAVDSSTSSHACYACWWVLG